MVKDVINHAKPSTSPDSREGMFLLPIQRLAKVDSFRADLATLHVTNAAQATHIVHSCQVVQERCQQIVETLNQRFI